MPSPAAPQLCPIVDANRLSAKQHSSRIKSAGRDIVAFTPPPNVDMRTPLLSRHPLAALALSASAAIALAGCHAGAQAGSASTGSTTAEEATSPAGVYAMPPPLVSELRVVALPGRPGEFRVEVHGGGDPRDGAGVAADCQAVAEGRLEDGRIEAPLQPFRSELGGLEAADLQSGPRLVVAFQGDSARLDGEFGHCPMGTAMVGVYRRTQAPKLMVDCPALPANCWNRD